METNEIPQILEAILFVAGEPVAIRDLTAALELGEMELINAVETLERACENRGVTIKRYGDHLRMETRAEYAPYVERLLQPVQRQTLSQSAMETLAVIAYRQPATKGDGGAGARRKVRLFHTIPSAKGAYQGGRPQGGAGPAPSCTPPRIGSWSTLAFPIFASCLPCPTLSP